MFSIMLYYRDDKSLDHKQGNRYPKSALRTVFGLTEQILSSQISAQN